MTAKEFLTDKTLESIDIASGVIINLVVDNIPYGLLTNTGSISVGTPIQRINNYTKTDDVITFGNITLDLAITEML